MKTSLSVLLTLKAVKKLTNRQVIEEAVKSWGMTVGGYSDLMEQLNKRQIQRVIEAAEYGSGDVEIVLNKKRYVVEVFHVDNEIDFIVTPKAKYIEQYGNNK